MNRPAAPEGPLPREGEDAPEPEDARDFADTQVSLPFPLEPIPGEGRPASPRAFGVTPDAPAGAPAARPVPAEATAVLATPAGSAAPAVPAAPAAPAVRSATSTTTSSPVPLALVEVLDRDGRVRQAVRATRWPLTIGRAIDNDVVLDDPHVAPHHALLQAGGAAAAELAVLPGVNGVRVGKRHAAPGERIALPLPAGGEALFGQTRLRVRLAGEALEPERPLPLAVRHGVTVALALVLWAWLLAGHALVLDPGSRASEWLPVLLGAPLALAAWSGLWATASKLFQHRFEFWSHFAVVVRGVLAIEVAGFVLPWASGLTGWPGFSRVTLGVVAAFGVALLVSHARLVLPQVKRMLGWAAAAAYVAGAGILFSLNQQRNDRWFNELYGATLPPPALHWAPARSVEAFVEDSTSMKATLEQQVREAAAEQKAAGEEDE